MKIAICGSAGKMGERVAKIALQFRHEIVSKIDKGTKESDFFANPVDVCIDFSSPDGLVKLCGVAAEHGIPVVSGTTGMNADDMNKINEYARRIPILVSSNFSIGVFLLKKLVKQAAKDLPSTFDVEIVEKHHNMKEDSPSGTALSILSSIKESRNVAQEIYGRYGRAERHPGEVCLHSVRGGDVVGEHEVYFFGNGEQLEINHRATSRDIFARGAIWVAEKILDFRAPGLYKLSDIIN